MMAGDLARLLRWKLALANGLAALCGLLVGPVPVTVGAALAVGGGVALLAAAGSALNQVQERDLDSCMQRTRARPLVTGRFAPHEALVLAVGVALGGSALLATCGRTPLLLGLLALLIYNGLYTPLKRRTSLALLVGALSGALPPLLGWCAAGGALLDPRGLLLAGLFFLWQLPHCGLLLLEHRADYHRAGLPTLATVLPPERLRALCRLWQLALLAGALILPLAGLLRPVLLWGYAAGLLFLLLPRSANALSGRSLRLRLDLFPLLLTVVLLAQ